MTELFNSKNGVVTKEELLAKLIDVGASDCDVLYIHTDMTFGLPVLKRKETLNSLYEVIEKLNVKTVVFPTFTFSFCNNEEFNTLKTPTKMGALNEFVRKNVSGTRTEDPLLSVYVVGDKLNLCDNLSHDSIGIGSNYDRLHECGKKVKFLFLGADMRQCFTYTHYMEAVFNVPYRYNREFSGTIIDANNEVHENSKFNLFSTYGNCRLNSVPVVYNEMKRLNQLNMLTVGDSFINCFTETDSYKTISALLEENVYFLTDGTFDLNKKTEIYNPNHEYIVSVR